MRWLEQCSRDADAIYLVGDVFDFWFEYSTVMPKGFVRLLGKLAELRDGGLPIYFFTGNHDMWVFHFFENELGIPTYRRPIIRDIQGSTFFIGDCATASAPAITVTNASKKYLPAVSINGFSSACTPTLVSAWRSFGRAKAAHCTRKPQPFWVKIRSGLWLMPTASSSAAADFFVFGHRHIPIDFTLKNGRSRYINTGEWLYACSYAAFDGERMEVCFFENENGKVYSGEGMAPK